MKLVAIQLTWNWTWPEGEGRHFSAFKHWELLHFWQFECACTWKSYSSCSSRRELSELYLSVQNPPNLKVKSEWVSNSAVLMYFHVIHRHTFTFLLAIW